MTGMGDRFRHEAGHRDRQVESGQDRQHTSFPCDALAMLRAGSDAGYRAAAKDQHVVKGTMMVHS